MDAWRSVWSKGSPTEHVLFLGNTGVGKSAICNALGANCRSATQASAVTTKHSLYTVNLEGTEVVLIDAPGLYEANQENVHRNVEEITAALDHSGKYRLIFVIRLEGGRLPFGDALAMKCITTAVKRSKGPIGVIINKISEDEMEMLEEPEELSDLKRNILTACGKIVQTGTTALSADLELMTIPVDGVGHKWNGTPPHAGLSSWLLKSVSGDILSVGKIQTPDELAGQYKADLDALQTQLDREKADRQRDKQQATAIANVMLVQMENIQNKLRASSTGSGRGDTKVTRVTDETQLPTALLSSWLKVPALFADRQEPTEVLVDKENFEHYCKARDSRGSYWTIAALTLYVHPIVNWATSKSAIHINSRRSQRLSYREVKKIETIIEGATHHDKKKIFLPDYVYDNTNENVDGAVKLNENKSTQITISHTLGAKTSLEQVQSWLASFKMSVPKFEGSGQLSKVYTDTTSLTTTDQVGAVTNEVKTEELTINLPAGKKVVVMKWCEEESWTTNYTTFTSYDGVVMWVTSRGDRRSIPANSLWPLHQENWQVTQKLVCRWTELS